MTNCQNCGAQVPLGANFCANCGEKVVPNKSGDTTRVIPVIAEEANSGVELTPDELEAIDRLPKGSALLIVQRGSDVGARYLLDHDENTAGRHPDCDVFLDDITVSRRHVLFRRADGGMSVRDLGSLNGTYVNRRLIDTEVQLRPGDEVQIGKFRLVYYVSARGLI